MRDFAEYHPNNRRINMTLIWLLLANVTVFGLAVIGLVTVIGWMVTK